MQLACRFTAIEPTTLQSAAGNHSPVTPPLDQQQYQAAPKPISKVNPVLATSSLSKSNDQSSLPANSLLKSSSPINYSSLKELGGHIYIGYVS